MTARRVLRVLRHPIRTIDRALWKHYSPDAGPLIQQVMDLQPIGGTVHIPAGNWKIGNTLVVRHRMNIVGGHLTMTDPGRTILEMALPDDPQVRS